MTGADETALELLSDRCGIGRDYRDYRGDWTEVSSAARMAVLGCMGFDASEAGAEQALAALDAEDLRAMPRTLLIRSGEPLRLMLKLPELMSAESRRLEIQQESGERLALEMPSAHSVPVTVIAGQPVRCLDVCLEHSCPQGYHSLQLLNQNGELEAECALLVAPQTSYQPEPLASGGKVFGISCQLYTLRSERNWGMGDFTDLLQLVRDAAAAGVQVLGLNPLHALFPANPQHFSPYSPSNRAFLNIMYIDPERVPGFADCPAVQEHMAAPEFQERLAGLREQHHVDYVGVADCKLPVLELLYRSFVEREQAGGTQAAREFLNFMELRGESLRLQATYDALHEHFLQQDLQLCGWPLWPEEYRQPDSPAVQRFAEEHADRIRYFQFLQWCAAVQLRDAQAMARESGMAVGIYLDLAVGVDLYGAEAWANQAVFCLQASAGAPPDELARAGQNWGFPPPRPQFWQDTAYRQFVDVLRANMSLCGAVRYDHAVSLLRLWWIPRGVDASQGAFVQYPLQDLLGVLALESQRNQCLVIGEDLGTVPDELRAMMEKNHLYAYKVLYFEKAGGAMIAPGNYQREAVATVSTHDLPTLASWWDESDIDLRAELGLLGDATTIESMHLERARDRQRLLDALRVQDCWQGEADATLIPTMTTALNQAVHRYLALSNSAVMMGQVEDFMEMLTPVNVPGTTDEHPNWQRKLRYPLEGLFQRETVARLCQSLVEARGQAAALAAPPS